MLRKRYRHLDFIKIPEFTKAGIPHLHALFFGIPRLIDADELREFWLKRYGEGTFVHIKKLYNGSNRVISYLVKYMSKLLDAPDHEYKGTDGLIDAQAFFQLSLAWALNLRAFSCARGILDIPPRATQTKKWVFLGVFDHVDVWSWGGRSVWSVISDLYELKPPPSFPDLWLKLPYGEMVPGYDS